MTTQPQRYGGLLGVVGGALALGGTFAVGTVDFMPEAGEAVASLTDDMTRLAGGGQVLVVGAVMLAAFGSVVHRRLRAANPSSPLAGMAASGYVAAAVAACVGACVLVAGALRADQGAGIDDAEATTIFDIGYVLIGGAFPALLALGVGATALASLTNATGIPTWMGWLGLPIAVGSLILPINWFMALLAMAWTVVAGVLLSTSSGSLLDMKADRTAESVPA